MGKDCKFCGGGKCLSLCKEDNKKDKDKKHKKKDKKKHKKKAGKISYDLSFLPLININHIS